MRSRLRAGIVAVLASLTLAGCSIGQIGEVDASPQEVAQAAYRHDGPPAITLYTMVSNNSGAGAHSSLMINGSERIIFDPAGTVRHTRVPERGDVLYGVTPEIARFYELAHARETFHVVVQRIEVSPAVAEQALQLAKTNGRVGSAFCTNATSGLLRKLPGFEHIGQTFFPLNLADQVGEMPGVVTRRVYDDDGDDKSEAIEAFSVTN
ncbi:hypothetical protein [Roseivivax sp. CAU 1753]